MWFQRVKERIAVQPVMAFGADFQRAVALRPRHAEDHIAICDLAVVQRDLCPLVYLTLDQLRRTGDAAAIFAAIGKVDPLIAKFIKKRPPAADLIAGVAAVGERNRFHSQISLVQSPPG